MVYVGISAGCLIPAFGISAEVGSGAPKVILALLASLLFCDWTKRVENGRTGSVDFQLAFWPAIVGLIAGAMSDLNGPYTLAAIALCATAALLVQAAAALWPFPSGRPVLSGLGGRHRQSFWRRHGSTPPSPPSSRPDAGAPPAGTARDATKSPPPETQRMVIERDAPSFVSRTANAGVAFIGKLLLLGGLLLAIGMPVLEQRLSGQPFRMRVGETVVVHDRVPEPLLIGIAVVGSMMMVLARRRAGGAHLLRGVIGCALVLWAVVMALGPASRAVELVFTTEWEALRWRNVAGLLAGVVLPLVASFVLLSWPHTRQYHDEIVI
jgi:hypothetical protein